MDDADALQWLSVDDITLAVQRLTGDDRAWISSWAYDPLVGSGEAIGVWRLRGEARTHGTTEAWSIVLKGWSLPETDAAPTSFNWPNREVELYSSGLLTDLPGGIRAPAWYGTMQRDDGTTWTWLEDITGDARHPQTPDDYALVARRLGQFNGAYLDDTPLPAHHALSNEWLRQWVEAAGPALERIARQADHPHVRNVYRPEVFDGYARLWDAREASLAVMDRLPRTFAHLDAFRRNIFLRRTPAGIDDVVLIDWSFAGIAAIGEDLAPLLAAGPWFMDMTVDDAIAMRAPLLAHYLDGLRDMGWAGDPEEVRAGYEAAVVLRYGLGVIRLGLAIVLDEWPHAAIEATIGRPIADYFDQMNAINRWMLGHST